MLSSILRKISVTPAPKRYLARHKRPADLLTKQAILLVLAALVTTPHADPLLTYPLRIGEHAIRAEVANTPDTRRKGLMFRTQLATSSGMIFVFPREQRVSMWMKNTAVPLSVAFIDSSGRIVNIEHMQPHSEKTHSSKRPARYALEMNQGWFSKHGIESGDLVTGLARLPQAK
ncbi:MAG: DUF192 domain-containing protein [Burkholderiales bacterium]|nr:DUF192 domain-containing protein [Burkholderiales bacterium]